MSSGIAIKADPRLAEPDNDEIAEAFRTRAKLNARLTGAQKRYIEWLVTAVNARINLRYEGRGAIRFTFNGHDMGVGGQTMPPGAWRQGDDADVEDGERVARVLRRIGLAWTLARGNEHRGEAVAGVVLGRKMVEQIKDALDADEMAELQAVFTETLAAVEAKHGTLTAEDMRG